MTRIVILGATGTVGRDLVARLAATAGVELVVTGRNPVILEHLERTFPVEALRFDTAEVTATSLPVADVLVDLTFSLSRHPRWAILRARRSIDLLLAYIALHPGARVVHTGTFAVLNADPSLGDQLCPGLLWSDSYLLAKSAAEQALRRHGPPNRVAVVRLGNMAVSDMTWTTTILRAVRDTAVGDPSVLARPANLSDVRGLAAAVLEPRTGLSYTPAIAGFTWGEVINEVAAAVGQPPLEGPRSATPTVTRSRPPSLSAVVSRALYLAPLSAASGPLEGLPAAPRWLAAGRRLVRGTRPSWPTFPARLPDGDTPIPGAARDAGALAELVGDMSSQFDRRGWRPVAPASDATAH